MRASGRKSVPTKRLEYIHVMASQRIEKTRRKHKIKVENKKRKEKQRAKVSVKIKLAAQKKKYVKRDN